VLQTANEAKLNIVDVKLSKPGVLSWEPLQLARHLPAVLERYDQLIADNYSREWFVAPELVDRETEERLARVLKPPIRVTEPVADSPFAT
jgi:hypothetical protein